MSSHLQDGMGVEADRGRWSGVGLCFVGVREFRIRVTEAGWVERIGFGCAEFFSRCDGADGGGAALRFQYRMAGNWGGLRRTLGSENDWFAEFPSAFRGSG